jgi:hypothetical protein
MLFFVKLLCETVLNAMNIQVLCETILISMNIQVLCETILISMNIQAGDNYLHKFDRFYTGVWTF